MPSAPNVISRHVPHILFFLVFRRAQAITTFTALATQWFTLLDLCTSRWHTGRVNLLCVVQSYGGLQIGGTAHAAAVLHTCTQTLTGLMFGVGRPYTHYHSNIEG